MGKINTTNYPNRPVSAYQDDDMFILQDNGGETYTTNVGDIKTLIDNKISGKADKVSSATAGNLAGLDANGNLTDSGISVSNGIIHAVELVASNGVTAEDTSYFNGIDMEGSTITSVSTLNVDQIDVDDGQAVEFLTDITVNGDVTDEGGNVLSNKTDKVESAVAGHLAGLDSNGDLTDSGVSPTEDVTVEGNPVTFDSPFEQDAKSVVVNVKPIQDLHGYDHPWPAGGGKNLYGGESNVIFDLPKVISANSNCVLSFTREGGENVTINLYRAGETSRYDYYTIGGERRSFTVTEDTARIMLGVPNDTTITNVQLELGSSATSYAPYSNICPISGIDEVEIGVSDGESEPTTTTIPLPSTLYDADVDVTEGSGDSRFKLIDLGSLDWTREHGTAGGYEYDRFTSTALSDAKVVGQYDITTILCSALENSASPVDFDIPTVDNSIVLYSNKQIYVNARQYTDATAFKAAMSGVQFCYELATPTTIQLTPTDVELLEGTNVVTTNAEKVAVTYGRSLWQDIDDLKTDTEGKLNKSDVADVEGDTASRPYAVNEFMLRSDGFYKVTQPIAQNASITASNTTKTTIGAVLTALLNA